MSIERCEKHGHYDTDLVEECPTCLDESAKSGEAVVVRAALDHLDAEGCAAFILPLPGGRYVACGEAEQIAALLRSAKLPLGVGGENA